MMDRREFSVTLGLATAAGLVRPRALFGSGQQATVFDWRTINDSMHVAFGAGGNALALVDTGSLVLVDTKNVGYGKALLDEAETFDGTVSLVINTHHHPDHIGGNPFFTSQVPVISQSNGVPRATAFGEATIARIMEDPIARLQEMTDQARDMDITPAAKQLSSGSVAEFVAMVEKLKPADFAATVTFDSEAERTVGSTVIQMRYVDHGHTDNDLFVWLPQANVLHCGDLFFNGLHPRIDVGAGANTVSWQRCIAAMVATANDDTVCIPGHGEISDVKGMQAFNDYFDILRDFVQKAIDAGNSRDEIMLMQPPQFQNWPPARLNQNLGIIYDELKS